MDDPMILNGKFDNIVYGVACNIKDDNWIINKLRDVEETEQGLDQTIDSLAEAICSAVLSVKTNEEYMEIPEGADKKKYQLRFGDKPYMLILEKNLFALLRRIGVSSYVMIKEKGNVDAEKFILELITSFYEFYKKAWRKIPPDCYCLYMYCQICANEAKDGIIFREKLKQYFFTDCQCKGWPIYLGDCEKKCVFYNEAEDKCDISACHGEKTIDETMKNLETMGVLIPLGNDTFRFAR